VPGFGLQRDDLDGLPVAVTHGTQDPLVAVERGQDARDRAAAGGADVVYRETEVPHIIDPRVVPGLVTWLDARF
jgi:phospholipase/carboxylesterase